MQRKHSRTNTSKWNDYDVQTAIKFLSKDVGAHMEKAKSGREIHNKKNIYIRLKQFSQLGRLLWTARSF